jgi:dimethylglycine catabolism A
MWRPPERIRYEPRPGRWPSADEAAASRLFSPVHVGTVRLTQRTWVPAMVPWRARPEGFVTPEVLAWYECFARGRPGAIVVEATGIRDVPSGPLLRIGHDRFLPGLRDLVRVVRDASRGETRLFIQLIDFLSIRRRPEAARFFAQFLAITARHRAAFGRLDAADSEVRAWLASLPAEQAVQVLDPRERESLEFGARERVTDMHLEQVRRLPHRLPALFAAASRRARQALADPDWFRKVAGGHGGQVRVCLYTNYCEALDQRHRQVTCELWDREGLDELGVKRAADGKRRLTPPAWAPKQ